MKFIKNPAQVEAERVSLLLFNAKNSWKDLPDWIIKYYDKGNIVFLPESIAIKNNEGDSTAIYSDWIINENNHIYICKNNTFKELYKIENKK